jgi:hypothetical protein
MEMPTQTACCATCGTAQPTPSELAIACTLGAGDLRERLAGIRDLASRHVLSSFREPLVLHLSYAPAALADVMDLVAKESACCAFLDFELRHDQEKVSLRITAPSSAAQVADELFAHFAPELAQVAA